MINSIAVLITCHNRKEKTLACLEHIFRSKRSCPYSFEMDVYLTDDGSTDGTGTEVIKQFPAIKILNGDGNLYWAGGMRKAWKEALKTNYDGFLLLNDDVLMDESCFEQLVKTHDFSLLHFGSAGIYVGSVRDRITLDHTYGGRMILNRWSFATQEILPDGNVQECHLGNGNIMFVNKIVVEKIGMFCEKYIHGKADYDYSLRAREKGFPLLVCPSYCGYCTSDKILPNLSGMNLKERIIYLKSPKGLELSGYMYFMWRFFPFRAPFVLCSLWLKTFFPKLSIVINKLMRRQ